MMNGLIHATFCAILAFGIYYDHNYIEFPRSIMPKLGIPRQTKFLTMWTLLLQTIYFFVAFANDLFGSNDMRLTKLPFIRRLRDYLFAALAFPSAMYVGVTFWSLWAIDRELVFPKALDEFFPGWLNHLMHTNIMVFIVADMFLTFRKYPSRKNGMAGMVVYLVLYLIWMHVIYFYSGRWVYPILDVLNWPLRIVFYLVSLVFGILLYLTGEFFNDSLWGQQLVAGHSKKSAKRKSN